MPGFNVQSMGTYPPAAPADFPVGIQFQYDGEDVGGRTIDTVNFVPGAALSVTVGTGETANVLTITIPSGSGVI